MGVTAKAGEARSGASRVKSRVMVNGEIMFGYWCVLLTPIVFVFPESMETDQSDPIDSCPL